MTNSVVSFSIPTQGRELLSFCDNSPDALENWLNSLSRSNLVKYLQTLERALQEINELKSAPYAKYRLLERFRKPFHFVRESLCQYQSRTLSSMAPQFYQEKQIFNKIQQALIAGYKQVVVKGVDATGWEPFNNHDKAITYSLHRAIAETNYLIVDCYQQYKELPPHTWYDLHSLYQLAQNKKLLEKLIKDDAAVYVKESTITDVYKKSLLLGIIQAPSLRPIDILHLSHIFEEWIGWTSLSERLPAKSGFTLDLTKDKPPLYGHKIDTGHALSLDVSRLVTQLQHAARQEGDQIILEGISVPPTVQEPLLHHLIKVWNEPAKRLFARMEIDGQIQVCLGIGPVHYRLAGDKVFEEFLRSALPLSNTQTFNPTKSNFLDAKPSAGDDVWANSFDAEKEGKDVLKDKTIDLTATKTGTQYAEAQVVVCSIVNTSAGGYCLRWVEKLPKNIQASELIAIKEFEDKHWNLAMIRWIQQQEDRTLIGVSLLSPKAEACAVRVIHKNGISDYMKGLLLPAIATMKRPENLIVPTLLFHDGDKVIISYQGQDKKAQLVKPIATTPSFLQYEFKWLA